ncbi:hypothetical protein MM213_02835 [Belliella sp. R4-6]|uniref:Glycosyltransferase RgtA/B/C/D-like domain-containing protein n=1 Tax=Belliella alkalica TaxID=1730871 RepID=A0ABS9V8X0_9BACT|nr:hypothetical protein [Belliella alkalica]MCH7412405.1 hypothetical protein [Belliella alkalica]
MSSRIDQKQIFIISSTFLVLFWFFGYDGITFSDDVFYILTGHAFWNGENVVNSYHFSSRFGSYIFSGVSTKIFGLNDRLATIPTLIAYIFSLLIIIKCLAFRQQQIWASVFFVSHVYLLHFLPKVYPDGLLVFWAVLIPFASIYRTSKPILSAFILVLAILIGFMTKETIIYLFPFPVILFLMDWKDRKPFKFHLWVGLFSVMLGSLYLGYFWYEFGDAFYRINSVNAGHYISEYSYNDKGGFAILKRLTITPFITFVQRSYWIWLVLAAPGVYLGLVKKQKVAFEFSLALICLLLGFWFMTTNLGFYNPIYLNPRHLIILIPVLAVLIGFGWKYWLEKRASSTYIGVTILLGALIGFFLGDYKNGAFLLVFGCALLFIGKSKLWLKKTTISAMLLIAVILSFHYQKQLKNYPKFMQELQAAVASPDQKILVVNNFVHFSREVLFPNDSVNQEKLFAIEELEHFENLAPDDFGLLIYNYYKHAYPKEAPDVEGFLELTENMGYKITDIKENQWVVFYSFSKN